MEERRGILAIDPFEDVKSEPNMMNERQDYWSKDIVKRLYERSDAAQAEGTGTSISDATHFRQAAAAIENLRGVVERAQSLISTSTYPNWHDSAKKSLKAGNL